MIATFRVDLIIEVETNTKDPEKEVYSSIEDLIKKGSPEHKIDIQDIECLHVTGD